MNTETKSDELSAQALVVYKMLHDQVDQYKKQQWTITNYAALIYAALFAVSREMKQFPGWVSWVLIAITIIAAAGAIALLFLIQLHLRDARQRVDSADEKIFGSIEKGQLAIRKEQKPFRRGLIFTGALISFVVIGALIVCFYVFASFTLT